MTEPIIVGVDGSAPSFAAAAWAGREAVLRRAPLRLLYAALRWPYEVPLVPQPQSWGEHEQEEALEMLRQAAVHARAGHRGLDIDIDIIDGRAGEALVAAADTAQLLVVGSRGRGGFGGLLLGSVSRRVASRAPCPVAVVRQPVREEHQEIVVGITGQPDQEYVIDAAFHEAALRRAVLRAVHAWRHPTATAPGDMQPLVYDVDAVGEQEALLLAESVAGWREKFPDVALIEQVVHDHPAKALINASLHADLVIIGAQARKPALLGLGGTAHAVLHHSHAPVLVMRR